MHRTLGRVFVVGAAAAVFPLAAQAQSAITITGRVTAEGGQPLGAVQVFIPSLNVGAQTRDDGRFTFTAPARSAGSTVTVTARRIGFTAASKQVALTGGSVTVDFNLSTAATQLTGVVVTALSQQREKATIGYSQTEVSSSQLNTTKDQSVLNQLAGKVAGVQINTSGNLGGSTRIVIRGANSITGDNQPLFVIDGIPVANTNITNASQATGNGGFDFGSTIRDLNPEDIESMTVLKGASAAALYGSRAANGAIVITTKKGRGQGEGVNVNVSSSTTFDRPLRLPSYQNLYGQGSGGEFRYVDGAGGGVQDGNDQSFGPRLDGRLIDQFTGRQQPWVAQPNNVADFFNTGRSFDNNLAISTASERASARISGGNQQIAGIIPTSRTNRTTASVSGELRVNDRLTTTGSVQYINNQANNLPGTGYNVGILEQFIWFGRQVDVNALRGRKYNADGSLFNWNSNYHNNPFWLMEDNPNRQARDNVIASALVRYEFLPWLSAQVRPGINSYRENRQNDYAQGNLAIGVDQNYAGGFNALNVREAEFNTEALVTANGSRGRFDLNAVVGGNVRRNNFGTSQVATLGLSVPGIYNVSNAAITPTLFQNDTRRGINSVLGSLSVTMNKYWTVDVTGRNDWSSTLPQGSNSFFYPSASTSLVLSDLFPSIQGKLDFLKLRASAAQTGNDPSPYQLATVFVGQPNKFGSLPQFTLSNTLANANLKPERTNEVQGGFELAALDNRVTFDATYYERRTNDQLITLPLSPTTGFAAQQINAGSVSNKGFEALLTVIPVRNKGGFTWTSTLNFNRNRSRVEELAPGLQTVVLGTSWSVNVEARQGQANGILFGNPFLRDSTTGQLVLTNGLPTASSTRRALGDVNPNWIGGWNNEVRYKALRLSALVDVRRGGSVFSVSNMFGTYTGVFSNTLEGREVDWNKPGLVVQGIDGRTGQPNTTNVSAEDYYQSLYGIHEAFVYDASFLKLRELRLGWDVPQRLLGRMNVRTANLSLVGRNLFLNTKVPNIDPETTLSTGNVQGLEFATIPTPRSIGLYLTLTP